MELEVRFTVISKHSKWVRELRRWGFEHTIRRVLPFGYKRL